MVYVAFKTNQLGATFGLTIVKQANSDISAIVIEGMTTPLLMFCEVDLDGEQPH